MSVRGVSYFVASTRTVFHPIAALAMGSKVGQVGIPRIQAIGSSSKQDALPSVSTSPFPYDTFVKCTKLLQQSRLTLEDARRERDFYHGLLVAPEVYINPNAHEDSAFIADRYAFSKREVRQIRQDIASLNACMRSFNEYRRVQSGEVDRAVTKIAERLRSV